MESEDYLTDADIDEIRLLRKLGLHENSITKSKSSKDINLKKRKKRQSGQCPGATFMNPCCEIEETIPCVS